MLAMFDPMTLPSAISDFPLSRDTTDEASSGSDVPPATSVMAITDSLMPSLRAISVALFRNMSPPKISPASPPAIMTTASQRAAGFLAPASAGAASGRFVVRIVNHISAM